MKECEDTAVTDDGDPQVEYDSHRGKLRTKIKSASVREKDGGKYEDELKEEIEQRLGDSEEFRMVKYDESDESDGEDESNEFDGNDRDEIVSLNESENGQVEEDQEVNREATSYPEEMNEAQQDVVQFFMLIFMLILKIMKDKSAKTKAKSAKWNTKNRLNTNLLHLLIPSQPKLAQACGEVDDNDTVIEHIHTSYSVHYSADSNNEVNLTEDDNANQEPQGKDNKDVIEADADDRSLYLSLRGRKLHVCLVGAK
ncbi:hypothetical protein DAPPUDRAFT_331927 [Daphnia pulex]|uniref:Uncharacterized protein n=1 Tax=Daphnia pulex TaxID=6669 RepID=E9HNU4_DAPPU|nr:hypothetical protein DAPPUDRAFT_331927 [Daphnia pulex]|eukprot:EFX66589.1 hypothetical protein DAPPUDRAFT_331927 [Daphnia pulex]